MAAKTEFEKLQAKIAKSLAAGRVVIVVAGDGTAHSNAAIDTYYWDDFAPVDVEKIKGGSLEKWLKSAAKEDADTKHDVALVESEDE